MGLHIVSQQMSRTQICTGSALKTGCCRLTCHTFHTHGSTFYKIMILRKHQKIACGLGNNRIFNLFSGLLHFSHHGTSQNHHIVISTQHDPDIDMEHLRRDVIENVICPVIPAELVDAETRIFVNPTGRFVIGGPQGDSGLTGRKIIVDTYGGVGRHGGGSFSGKDPTKVDRSAAYAARYAAKNIVAQGYAKRCEIQLAYAIGVAKPVSVRVDTFGTGTMPDAELEKMLLASFDFRPAAIIEKLDLRRPIYKKTAAYGHFGRDDADFPWEKVDLQFVK